MANLNYLHNQKHELTYNFIMLHASRESVGDYLGMDADYQSSDTYEGFMRRQQTNDNLLFVNQFDTKWALTDKLDFNAGAAYNIIKGLEPDRRINNSHQQLGKDRPGLCADEGDGHPAALFLGTE